MKISFFKTYKELKRLDKLQDKRHPMFEKNRFTKFLIYFMFLYYAGLLIFLGVVLAKGLDGSMASFHLFDQGFFYLLLVDFWCRFALQQTPAQQIKPLTILPLSRKRLMDVYLIRTGLAWGNIFTFTLLVPFALIAIWPYYGIVGVLGWLFGYWLLLITNSYWYLFCRALIIKNMLWLILPVIVDAVIVLTSFYPENHLMSYFYMDWIEQFIFWNPFAYLPVILCIVALFYANHKLQYSMTYNEVAKTEEKELKQTSEFKMLNKYGILGEYLKLEIRMRMRNKNVKKAFLTGLFFIFFFSLALSFGDMYDGTFMTNFICLYNYLVFGMMTLATIMGFEGNYIDGLMSRHESIFDLLRAKYIFNLGMLIIPFLIMIPTIATGKVSLLMNLAYLMLVAGFIYPAFFQLAVYNSQTIPLNTKMTANNGTWVQQVITLVAMFAPIAISQLLVVIFGETIGFIILIGIGIAGVATHKIWIRNIYQRFMQRRYKNMEGFRASRNA